MKQAFFLLGALLLLVFHLLHPEITRSATIASLTFSLMTFLPSVFLFYLLGEWFWHPLVFRFLTPLTRLTICPLLGCSSSVAVILFVSIVFGTPTVVRWIDRALFAQLITEAEADVLLRHGQLFSCSFLYLIVFRYYYDSNAELIPLLLCYYGASFALIRVSLPPATTSAVRYRFTPSHPFETIQHVVMQLLQTMAIFLLTFIAFYQSQPFVPPSAQLSFSFLEITIGLSYIAQLQTFQFWLLAALSFGGFALHMQLWLMSLRFRSVYRSYLVARVYHFATSLLLFYTPALCAIIFLFATMKKTRYKERVSANLALSATATSGGTNS